MFFDKIKSNEGSGDANTGVSSDLILRLKEAAGYYDDVSAQMVKLGAELSNDPVILPLKAKWHNAIRGLSESNCLASALVDMASPDSKKKANAAPLIQAVMSGSFMDAGKLILKLGLTPAEVTDIEHALGDKALILKNAAATMAMLSGREFKDPSGALDYAKTQLMSNEKIMSLVSGLLSKS